MKKIILSVLSVLMIFGLIGCSGDLHDYKDPEVFEGGTWYYYDVPTDAANVIFNVAGGNQSSDIKGIDVSGGSIYYAWDSTVGSDNPGNNLVFEPGDKPAGQAGRVWCYTNAASTPNCYWWGCADAENDAGWPGKPMTKNGEAPVVVPVYTITLVVDGFAAEQTVVANGTPWGWNGWPFEGWLCWNDGVQDVEQAKKDAKAWIDANEDTQVFKADDTGIIVVTIDVEGLPGSTAEVMFVEATVSDGVYASGNQTGNIPVVLPEEPGSYVARITFAKDTTTPAKFN